MKKQGTRECRTGLICIVAFIIWTILIQHIDVQPVGPRSSSVGFATWNAWFHQLTGVHMSIYTITDWLGLVPIFICIGFGVLGLTQWIRRRSLLKVDYDIILLGIYYIAVIFAYLIFEMIPLNYRPVLIEGILEASYPSSTTLLVLSVMPTLKYQIDRRVKSQLTRMINNVFVVAFSAFMVIGRLIAGVHWFTDIVGSILISAGLFFVYKGIVEMMDGIRSNRVQKIDY